MNTLGSRTRDITNVKNSNFFNQPSPSYNFPNSYSDLKHTSTYGSHQLPLHQKDPINSIYKNTMTLGNQKSISNQLSTSITGMQNLGNTCFMNTCIQILMHTEPFMERIFESRESINFKTPITKRFYDIGLLMESSLTPISLNEFKRAFGERHSLFQGYGQHDTQEFCRLLLEDISLELNKVKEKTKYVELNTNNMSKSQSSKEYDELFRKRENSIVIDTFYGQIINIFTCPCSYKSYSFDKILDVPLLLPLNDTRISLGQLLDSYFESEKVQWETKCSKCQKKSLQIKDISFVQLPEILILSFQRINGRTKRKNNIEISFDEQIDMKKYIERDCLLDSRTRYELYGVSNHSGTMDFGHYFAQIKIDGNWAEFNDASVSKWSQFKRSSNSAYVLFYRKK